MNKVESHGSEPGRSISLPPGSSAQDIPDEAMSAILGVIHDGLGSNFFAYKRSTLERRLHKRMQMLEIDGLDAYLIKFRDDEDEQRALAGEFLIHVTSFFRDPENFEQLRETVIRPMIEQAHIEDEVRIWVPACSSGQEAFSLAMMVEEMCEQIGNRPLVKIFATDIDRATIAQARRAEFPVAMLSEIPSPYREKYTVVCGERFTIAPQVSEMVCFSVHDIAQDPPLSMMDLISCRNLLIYLGHELQMQLFALMHFSLKLKGHLFLGASEYTKRNQELFLTVNHAARIYQRNDDCESGCVGLPIAQSIQEVRRNRAGDTTRKIVDPAPGTSATGSPERAEEAKNGKEECLFDLAHESRAPVGQGDQRIAALESELKATRATLKAKVREIETTNEELVSANEQMLSMNEELQSANEELITINHELRSKVDELTLAYSDLDNFLQSADLAMIVLDASLGIRHVTNAARHMFAHSSKENEYSLDRLNMSLDDIDLTEEVRKVFEKGTVFSETCESNRQGRSYLVRITPQLDPDSCVIGASITLVDISQEVELRRKLAAETRKLHLAMEAANMGAWVTDRETGRLTVDATGAQLAGLEGAGEYDRSELQTYLKPVDAEKHIAERDEALARDEAYSHVLQLDVPGAPRRWVKVHASPFEDEDGCRKVVGLGIDVTEIIQLQRELEEQTYLRKMVMNAGRIGMADLGVERQIATVDEVSADHLNLAKAGVMPGGDVLANVFEEDLEVVQEKLAGAIERGEEYEIDFRVKDPEAGVRWVRTRGRPFTTIDGVKKVAGATLDISPMKNQQLMVEEMSHRIKNLFAVVGGLIQAAPKPHPAAEHMASDLLERVVSLGRVYDLARKEHAMKGVPLGALLHSILEPHALGHCVEIEGPTVFVDGDRVNTLTLIIHELTTNAVKYGALGSPDGRLEVSWTVSEDMQVQMKWSEYRPGFSPPSNSDGFGTLLIDSGVRQLKGNFQRRFTQYGVLIDLLVTL